MIMISRISFSLSSTENLPFDFRRTQFLLRLAFAMTINKTQDQMFNYIELCLKKSIFTHRQLYITLSRIMNAANLRMIISDIEKMHQEKIKNIIYSEVFN